LRSARLSLAPDLLATGILKRYIDELSVTGLTSNPTIFDQAIKNSTAYDAAIRNKLKESKSGEELFFELAIEDLTQAADMFRPIWDRVDVDALAERLQDEGANSFVSSWRELMGVISAKSAALAKAK
jgi:transaldolase